MDLRDWYFKQIVSQGEMDQAFEWAEDADHEMMTDVDLIGIHSGGDTSEKSPTPDLSVNVSSIKGHDSEGKRLSIETPSSNIPLDVDEYGTSTEVTTPAEERYISLFVRYKRDPQSPAVDGNGLTVYTIQQEDAEYFVRQGASSGSATPPALLSDALLLCDIKRVFGQTTIQDANIELTRRQDWMRLTGTSISELNGGTPKEVIEELFSYVDAHHGGGSLFTFAQNWADTGVPIGPSPPIATVKEALNGIVYDLTQWGTGRVGSLLIGTQNTTGTYINWTNETVNGALLGLAGVMNGHIGGSAPQHPDTSITAAIKNGSPTTLPNGSVSSQMQAMLDAANDHFNGASSNLQHSVSKIKTVASDTWRQIYIDDWDNGATDWSNYTGQITSETGGQAYVIDATSGNYLIVKDITTLGDFDSERISQGATYVVGDSALSNLGPSLSIDNTWDSSSLEEMMWKLTALIFRSVQSNNGDESKTYSNIIATNKGMNRISRAVTLGAVSGGSGRPTETIEEALDYTRGAIPTGTGAADWGLPWTKTANVGAGVVTSWCKGYSFNNGIETVMAVSASAQLINFYYLQPDDSYSTSQQLVDVNGADLTSPEVPFQIASNSEHVYVLTDLDGTGTNCRLYCYKLRTVRHDNDGAKPECIWQTDFLNHDPDISDNYQRSAMKCDAIDNTVFIVFGGQNATTGKSVVGVNATTGAIKGSGRGTMPSTATLFPTGALAVAEGRAYFGYNGDSKQTIASCYDNVSAGAGPLTTRLVSATATDVLLDLEICGTFLLCGLSVATAPQPVYNFVTDNAGPSSVPTTNVIFNGNISANSCRVHYDGQLIWYQYNDDRSGNDTTIVRSVHPSELIEGVTLSITATGYIRPKYYMEDPSAGANTDPIGMIMWGGALWSFQYSSTVTPLYGAGALLR
jgi:hypothetical protein